MTTKTVLEPGEDWGDLAKPHCPIEPDIWRRIIKDGVETGFIKRFKWKSLGEIAKELNTALDLFVCDNPACGWEKPRKQRTASCKKCKGTVHELIDEYFGTAGITGRENQDAGPFQQIICYPETGGNEGHGCCIGALKQNLVMDKIEPGANFGELLACRKKVLVYDHWFRIKTFRGMDHAIELTRRVVALLGI